MARSNRDLASPDSPYAGVMNPRVEWIRALLDHINQYCGEADRDRVIGAVCQASAGSTDGLMAVDEWYRRRADYPGDIRLLFKWKSFEQEPNCSDGFAVLCEVVEGYGFNPPQICADLEPGFEPCSFEVIEPTPIPENGLTRFSLAGQLEALERDALVQTPILGGLALLGQATNLYAAPNTGKTLLTMWLLIDSIKAGLIEPERVFYINADDNLNGLIEKLHLAEEFRFHMVAEGYRDFHASHLLNILDGITSNGQAHGVIVIIDVIKKVVDIMSKRESSEFGKVIRRFVLQGGTCISLSHTNKKPGHDGRPVFGGTSDSLEDTDNAYVMQIISDVGAREKVVAFDCSKRRGNVRQRAVFGYSVEEGITYDELLASVRPIADGELASMQKMEVAKSDAEMIAATKSCVRDGVITKMQLATAIAQRTGCSKRTAIKLLERYCGTDPKEHVWTYDLRARGAKTFRLLVDSETSDQENV